MLNFLGLDARQESEDSMNFDEMMDAMSRMTMDEFRMSFQREEQRRNDE